MKVWTLALLGSLAVAVRAEPSPGPRRSPRLGFEENRGQVASAVRFLVRGRGETLFITPGEAVLSLRGEATVRMQMIGALPRAEYVGVDPMPFRTHHLRGKDPAGWITGVPVYESVLARGIYPGIDMVYRFQDRSLEYDFIVSPGRDPSAIQLAFPGSTSFINASGDLVVDTAVGPIVHRRPRLYQETHLGRRAIEGGFRLLSGSRVGFVVEAYDPGLPLVIDPIVFSTYFGGGNDEDVYGVAVDRFGYTYLAGYTLSADLPVENALQPEHANPCSSSDCLDAFVVKLTPDGSGVVYATYLGGSELEHAFGIAADGSGSAYIVGTTRSLDFPTTAGAAQMECERSPFDTCQAAFVSKIDATGSSLVYSTYVSGGYNYDTSTGAFDQGYAIAVDVHGNAYIAGNTNSKRFPTTPGAYQENFGGASDAFVVKLNSGGSERVYATYIGGDSSEDGNGIAVDPFGYAYVTGHTLSHPTLGNSFPTVNALQPEPVGLGDGFVVKLIPDGSNVVYATFLGGTGLDTALGIATDPFGNAYVTGQTKSDDFPIVNAPQPVLGGGPLGTTTGDGFVTKINATGQAYVYSTFLGGRFFDNGWAVAADSAGNAYVIGDTDSPDFPLWNAVQGPRGADAFVTKIGPWGLTFPFSTYIGGTKLERGAAIDVDDDGNIYAAGLTFSLDFPAVNALQDQNAGGFDAFIAKIAQPCTLDVDMDYSGGRLFLDFHVGAEKPVTWIAFLVVGGRAFQLFSIGLPALPPRTVPVSFPLPPIGALGIFTMMVTPEEFVFCSDWESINPN